MIVSKSDLAYQSHFQEKWNFRLKVNNLKNRRQNPVVRVFPSRNGPTFCSSSRWICLLDTLSPYTTSVGTSTLQKVLFPRFSPTRSHVFSLTQGKLYRFTDHAQKCGLFPLFFSVWDHTSSKWLTLIGHTSLQLLSHALSSWFFGQNSLPLESLSDDTVSPALFDSEPFTGYILLYSL